MHAIDYPLIEVGGANAPHFAAKHNVVAVVYFGVSTPDWLSVTANKHDAIAWHFTAIHHASIRL